MTFVSSSHFSSMIGQPTTRPAAPGWALGSSGCAVRLDWGWGECGSLLACATTPCAIASLSRMAPRLSAFGLGDTTFSPLEPSRCPSPQGKYEWELVWRWAHDLRCGSRAIRRLEGFALSVHSHLDVSYRTLPLVPGLWPGRELAVTAGGERMQRNNWSTTRSSCHHYRQDPACVFGWRLHEVYRCVVYVV